MAADFLLSPTWLRLFSGILHLIALLTVAVTWACSKCRTSSNQNGQPLHTGRILYSCMVLSLFNLALCVSCLFIWYGENWSDKEIVILFDLGVRTLSWFFLFVLLKKQYLNSIALKLWWGGFALMSCYCLMVDILYYEAHRALLTLFWASDVSSLVVGIFLCYSGLVTKGENTDLQEPLLNVDPNANDAGSATFVRREERVTSFANVGFFATLWFTWMSPLISLGYKKKLDIEDIPHLPSFDTVGGTFPIFNDKLESCRGEGNRITAIMIAKGLMFTTRWEITISAVYVIVFTLASFTGPLLIDSFVQYMNGQQRIQNEGYMLVFVFTISKLLQCAAQRQFHFRVQQAGNRARAALVSKIYNKGLSLSCQLRQGQTSGEIINLLAVDAERISNSFWSVHDPWTIILDVGLSMVILYKNVGLASLSALAVSVVLMLGNIPLAKFQQSFQTNLMKSKDNRMKTTAEVLNNMRILKFQAWEMKFLSKILELRNVEAKWLRRYLYTQACLTFIFYSTPAVVSLASFGTCILMGTPLESGKVLSTIATITILQQPIFNLPDLISVVIQTKVSLDRVASFLSQDDLQPDIVMKLPFGTSETAVEIFEGNFLWDEASSTTPTLKDINLKVSHGMKIAICGTVGSGKSSLLSCILGEMPKLSGMVRVCGTKAYVAQSPWIRSGSIEDNILFCKGMDRQRYDNVLDACSLKKDLEIFAYGDQTIIGERGINLSGGQKQRIQIARALYQDTDIYLFDDPFSALDAHTGSHLFNECILGFLDSKTVIYVTHQVEFLPAADIILVMKHGEIKQTGKYEDILKSGSDFEKLVGAHEEALSAIDLSHMSQVGNTNRQGSGSKSIQKQEPRNGETDRKNTRVEQKGQLVQDEEREKGSVSFSVYWRFITTAYGGLLVPFILLLQVLYQTFQIASSYWIAWATPVSKDVMPHVGTSKLIFVYTVFTMGTSFCMGVRSILVATGSYKTANTLFEKMHQCIFRAPMSFFDSTPSGRIINRASTDQSTVDLSVGSNLVGVANASIQLLGVIIVVSQVVWQVFIIFIPAVAFSIWLQQYYIPSARELSRLSGVSKAPVIQNFSEMLSGSNTIRSFNQESNFRSINTKLIDEYARPKFHGAGAMEWLGIRLDVLSLFTFVFPLIILVMLPKGTVDPSIAGLAVTYGSSLNGLQGWLMWLISTLETSIISVERMFQYSSLPSEPPLVLEVNRPGNHWPRHGEVNIQDLKVRYSPHMPLVIRGLTCTFFGEKKTGIVGRTGSGKSTLIQTLFRIVEPAGGQILIDGINILSIGLHDLRSRLSIIPQEPTMFQGTIRNNMDPLEEYTDKEIWEALDKCQLGDLVRQKECKLDSEVSENGENWSVGQRQLICIARVLLKKSKILVLDEATASVDTEMDNLIQQTLRQHFMGSTVITIAHRITSVLDSDMIMLLDDGLMKEFDTPGKLLEDESSMFAKLVAEYSMRSSLNN